VGLGLLMGYNSLVMILNDAMGEIDERPAEWWRETNTAFVLFGN